MQDEHEVKELLSTSITSAVLAWAQWWSSWLLSAGIAASGPMVDMRLSLNGILLFSGQHTQNGLGKWAAGYSRTIHAIES